MTKFLIILTITILLMGITNLSFACDVCSSKQPTVLKKITHGTGPENQLDYIIIWTAVITVLGTLYLSIKFLINPREKDKNHIKNIIVENEIP